ncbi:hypothetical protein F4804DRAFT_321370 [Jackrogersella minutella]|nr:hypothetical protein F4804DRAFT_321370 [Jackrogersella minutella]
MDLTTLDPRDPKGGKGKFRGGNGGFAAGGGGGNAKLPLWVYIVIAVGVVWVCIYITLFLYFYRRGYTLVEPSKRPRRRPSFFGRIAWKAFRYATLLQLVIWSFRKLRARFQRTKHVGGTFYRKIEEEERGVKEPSEPLGTPVAQLRRDSPADP